MKKRAGSYKIIKVAYIIVRVLFFELSVMALIALSFLSIPVLCENLPEKTNPVAPYIPALLFLLGITWYFISQFKISTWLTKEIKKALEKKENNEKNF